MKPTVITFLASILLSANLTMAADYVPHRGDILFQGAGTSEFSQSIAASTTADTVEFRPIHVAFVAHGGSPDQAFVIEAEPKLGVCLTPYNEFIDNSAKSADGKPMVVVKRIKSPDFTAKETAVATQKALTLIGQPYDWVFLPDNNAVYCSELIQLSFRNPDGTPMFNYIPLNFKGPDGTILPFWQKIYDDRSMSVPQGEPGTSPVSILTSPLLIHIHSFYK